jgi:hypothetical protein
MDEVLPEQPARAEDAAAEVDLDRVFKTDQPS